jgi:integrase
MRGCLKRRYKGSWSIILNLGYEPHPSTGKLRRKQKWITFRGTKDEAETKLAELITAVDKGTLLEPSKLTLKAWLDEWLKTLSNVTASTVERYRGIIDNHVGPSSLGGLLLQQVRPSHLEQYYSAKRPTMQSATLTIHHLVISQAFEKAVVDRLVSLNPAKALGKQQRPRRSKGRASEVAREHCWTAAEARSFLKVARASGPQAAAFYSLAIDTGMRKGELCGLKWIDVDLVLGRIQIARQLVTPGPSPVFGPTKTKRARTVRIGAEMVELLKAHKQHQAELKMANRTTYHDLGLVFAKEWSDVRKRGDCLGHPLQKNNLGQREYAKLIKAAGVRPIKFHGLRHTCATVLLASGEAVPVVAERLGHAKGSMTLDVYAHATEDLQHAAATKIGALLHS